MIRTALYETVDGIQRLASAWDRLEARGCSGIFTSSAWAIAAWRHFPDLGQPRLVAAFSGTGELVGVMPLTLGQQGPSWAGSPLGDEHDVQIHPKQDPQNIGRLLVDGALRLPVQPRVVRLTDVRHGGTLSSLAARTSAGCPAPVLRLDGPDPEFGELACIRGWSRHRRRGLRSQKRMLEQLGHVRMDRVINPRQLTDVLPLFVQQRLQAWDRRGRLDQLPVMDCHPSLADFLVDVATRLSARGLCFLARLLLDDSPIAQALYFRAPSADLLYMSTYSDQLTRYSPSHLLLAASAATAVSEDVRVIELGRGDEPYKFDHGAELRHLDEILLNREPP